MCRNRRGPTPTTSVVGGSTGTRHRGRYHSTPSLGVDRESGSKRYTPLCCTRDCRPSSEVSLDQTPTQERFSSENRRRGPVGPPGRTLRTTPEGWRSRPGEETVVECPSETGTQEGRSETVVVVCTTDTRRRGQNLGFPLMSSELTRLAEWTNEPTRPLCQWHPSLSRGRSEGGARQREGTRKTRRVLWNAGHLYPPPSSFQRVPNDRHRPTPTHLLVHRRTDIQCLRGYQHPGAGSGLRRTQTREKRGREKPDNHKPVPRNRCHRTRDFR